jgi:formamidopyrimidine-DNA glycosylase
MPELPEVEWVVRGLKDAVGERIESVWSYAGGGDELLGQTIKEVTRRGKWIIIHTDKFEIIMHLRLTGAALLQEKGQVNKHLRALVTLSSGEQIVLIDPRKFATFEVVPSGGAENKLSNLSLEPIDPGYTGEYLYERLQGTRRGIKAALLDQSIACGMGNIYVDETLYELKIHPEKPANTVDLALAKALVRTMRRQLLASIDVGGSSVRNYIHADGKKGSYQYKLNAYGRKGEPCSRCQTSLVYNKVAGRGTTYCPQCQQL